MDVLHQSRIVAAQGYSELDLPDLALAELDALPPEVRSEAVAVEMRLLVLMHAKRFKQALPLGKKICDLVPDKTAGFIHTAFCLHELGRTQEAREVLIAGPLALKAEPTYHYNLACYEAALGNIQQARAHLDVSFSMDKKLKDYARKDPDLKVLHEAPACS